MTDTIQTSDVLPQVDEYRDLIEKMRSPDVTANNSATAWGRVTLAKCLETTDSGAFAFTPEMATIAVCSVYKPRTATGKVAMTKGALKLSGFTAMSARLTDIEYIIKNIGVEGVRPIVDAFVASTKAADSFAACTAAVRAQVKAIAKAAAGADSEGEGESEGEKPMSVLQAAVEFLASADADTLASLASEIADLRAALDLIEESAEPARKAA